MLATSKAQPLTAGQLADLPAPCTLTAVNVRHGGCSLVKLDRVQLLPTGLVVLFLLTGFGPLRTRPALPSADRFEISGWPGWYHLVQEV